MADKSGKPFVESYLGFLLAKTSYQLSGEFHSKLRARGISIATWRILASVNDAERSVNELASLVLLNQPTLSKNLDRMEAHKLVTRKRCEQDRRSVFVFITDQGRALIEELIPLANQHEQASFRHLSAKERGTLVRLLQKTIAGR